MVCDTPVPEPGRYGEATMAGERKEAVVVCPGPQGGARQPANPTATVSPYLNASRDGGAHYLLGSPPGCLSRSKIPKLS